jgi:TPP-dependent indolepyruvate ferredoxin oxidoreductase alpha subunit
MSQLLENVKGKKMFLLGNEAIVRGSLEAGLDFAASYPGTPSSEIGNTFYEIGKKANVYFEFSTNEKVAMEVAAAGSACGLRAMTFMKHVGLNVAADAFMTVAYTGVRGGFVIISADDPGCHSSQNEQDNRYYARIAKVPMLEPANAQEAKDMTVFAFRMSEEIGMSEARLSLENLASSAERATLTRIRRNSSQSRRMPGSITFCCWSGWPRPLRYPRNLNSTKSWTWAAPSMASSHPASLTITWWM